MTTSSGLSKRWVACQHYLLLFCPRCNACIKHDVFCNEFRGESLFLSLFGMPIHSEGEVPSCHWAYRDFSFFGFISCFICGRFLVVAVGEISVRLNFTLNLQIAINSIFWFSNVRTSHQRPFDRQVSNKHALVQYASVTGAQTLQMYLLFWF